MLQQALNRHSQVVIPPETAFFSYLVGHTRPAQRYRLTQINQDLGIKLSPPARRVRTDEQVRALFDEIARQYLARLGRQDVTHFGEKTPHHLFHLRRIQRAFPNAKILLIHRDGRDVAMSLSKVPWSPPDLDVCFATWLRYYRWHRWALSSGLFDLHVVCYEALATNPEAELRKIAAFLELAYEPQMAQGSGNREGICEWQVWKARAVEKISPERVGAWRRELKPEQIARLERWGGHALKELGYELLTNGRRPLPWWFFPRLCWVHNAWRARCLGTILKRELLGR